MAIVWPDGDNDPEWMPNARLIAAAPDLLEALEGAVCDGFCYHMRCDRGRAAIAKAKGEA